MMFLGYVNGPTKLFPDLCLF